MTVAFVDIDWRGQPVCIEHAWVGVGKPGEPIVVFLHEGLGSLSMWRDFPARLCHALGLRGLVYSRPGYGRSTQRGHDASWGVDFMHRQAHEVLPALLQALALDTRGQPPLLFGHSDGGSIALLHAARFPDQVSGVIVMAPHIQVEAVSVRSIEAARQAYLHDDLKQRLSRHHDDPDSAFWGWNRIWLDPMFRSWTIEADIGSITAPLLAIQGVDDEYGTLEQIRGIRRQVPQTQLLELAACRHAPHRDQPDAIIAAALAFDRSRNHPNPSTPTTTTGDTR